MKLTLLLIFLLFRLGWRDLMARYLFPPELVFNPDGTLAANVPFSMWSDLTSGSALTDLVDVDGVTEITLTTDGSGVRPALRGPDGVKAMYTDVGAPDRYPTYSNEALTALLNSTIGDLDGGTI